MNDFFGICDDTDSAPTSGGSRMPLIGDTAPEFRAETTNGTLEFPQDYAGKWVILFSHPSDFTPVCTSEFMAFQSQIDDFKALNTELVGLSVGTLTSHLAWLNAIRDINFNGWENLSITFPVIDDATMRVAKLYGMIHPNASDTHTVRAVFIIDPTATIRTILYYPASTGRNFSEIMRILVALQTTDAFKVSTPADWVPGDEVLIASPTTINGVRDIMKRGPRGADVHAWFLTSKELSERTIMEKLHRVPQSQSRKKK